MKPTLHDIYHLYRDGFAQMKLGRTLWAVIIVKLIVIFAVLKVCFFPDYLAQKATDGDKAAYVSAQLTRRTAAPKAKPQGAAAAKATPQAATKEKPDNQK